MFTYKLIAASCKYLAYLSGYTLVPTVFIGIWPAVLIAMPNAGAMERALVTVAALYGVMMLNWGIWNLARNVYLRVERVIEEVI